MKTSKTKRIIALVGVVLIVLCAIATLVTAIADSTGTMFRSFLILTIAMPIAVWVSIWAFGAMTNRHTVASFDLKLDLPEDNNESDIDETVSADNNESAIDETVSTDNNE